MKVLLCHAYYHNQRGGEDRCFEEEGELLRAHGHEVIEYARRNSELVDMNPLAAAATAIWNRSAARDVAGLIERHRPDVLHVTNTFPLISPAVCDAAHRRGVAVVQALHNYRLLCANSYLMRDGAPCESCVGAAIPWAALLHRCYRDSAAATAAVAAMQTAHRVLRVWRNRVDAFFTVSEFARQRFIAGGLPADRIHVKYNSVSPDPGVGRQAGGYAIFVGRLSPEKGIAAALAAWKLDPSLPPLVVVGDGPLRDAVERAACEDSRITCRGELPNAAAQEAIKDAALLVMPSVWYETFGRTIAEAFAAGVPVVASRLGAMAELVNEGFTGRLFAPGNPAELAAAVRAVIGASPEERAAMAVAARAAYERQFTPQHNYQRLMEIYLTALEQSAPRRYQLACRRSTPAKPAVGQQQRRLNAAENPQ